MKWMQIPHGTIVAAEGKLWSALDESAGQVADRLANDPRFLVRVTKLMQDELKPGAGMEKKEGFPFLPMRTVLPSEVSQMREVLHMDREEFAETFGFSVETIKNWDGSRSNDHPSAIATAFFHLLRYLLYEVRRTKS